MKKTLNDFNEIWEYLTIDRQIEIWNKTIGDPEIFENDEEFFETYFSSALDAVRAVCYGEYRYGDRWVWFNAYGNLSSTNISSQLPIDGNMVFSEFSCDMELAKKFSEFEDWYEEWNSSVEEDEE